MDVENSTSQMFSFKPKTPATYCPPADCVANLDVFI